MPRGQTRGFDGTALRRHRERRGLARADLADLIGVSTSTVAKWEAGKQAPDPRSAAKVRALLQLDRDALCVLDEHDRGIADLRRIAGFTAQEAARRVRTTRAALAEVEAGRRILDIRLARALGELYGVDPARLQALWERARDERRARLVDGLAGAEVHPLPVRPVSPSAPGVVPIVPDTVGPLDRVAAAAGPTSHLAERDRPLR